MNRKSTSNRVFLPLRDAWDVVRHRTRPEPWLKWFRQRKSGGMVLNEGEGPAYDGNALIKELRKLRNGLKTEAISEQGEVNYQQLRTSAIYQELVEKSKGLIHFPIEELVSDDQRKVFWINLYNVLAIHGVIALGIEKSVMEVPGFFESVAYNVGGQLYQLDDIEQGILRGNAIHPVSKRKLFGEDDPRLPYKVSRLDPRIHMVLVCASRSCPPVAFLEEQDLEVRLDQACELFVQANVHVKAESSQLQVPILFYYYADDFGTEQQWREFLLQYADDSLRSELQTAWEHNFEVIYERYDWTLNSLT
jgi:hypothetical protein